MAKEAGEMYRAGVKLMPGTDTGATLMFPGFDLHQELSLFVKKIGLTPAEALRSATLVPAEFYGISTAVGTIEKGKLADLVMLDANPLTDIANTGRISAVVADGRFLASKDLQQILAQTEQAIKTKRKKANPKINAEK
jgi:imidazolonepropionase-like amidohydrolase